MEKSLGEGGTLVMHVMRDKASKAVSGKKQQRGEEQAARKSKQEVKSAWLKEWNGYRPVLFIYTYIPMDVNRSPPLS